MKKYSKHIVAALFFGVLAFVSCETTELDITENPNALIPSQANPEFLLNSIQEDFVRLLEGVATTEDLFQTGNDGLNELGMELTRTANFFGRNYQSAFQGVAMDDEWINLYRGILAGSRSMTPLAEAADLTHHIGIAQFIEAYSMTAMVDFFGDIPYTEAGLLDEGIQNPVADSGASIYAASLVLLDQAIANFNSTAAADPTNDFFYDNDYSKWVLAANTLKMKLYLQTRLVDSGAAASFNAIVTGGDFIQDTADDFQYQWYATSATQPDTRHPRYGINYTQTGAQEYMSNWFMNLLATTTDPRLRYYIYRQTDAVPGAEIPPDEQVLTCSLNTPPAHYVAGGFTFCWLDNGYWGRDHGDADGTPPDGLLRATWGVYPAGGRFDDSSFTAIAQGTSSNGANGAGITPILTAFMVDYWRAEMALVAGQTAEAGMFLTEGVTKQIAKVQSFGALDAPADLSLEPTEGDVTAYLNTMNTTFTDGDDMVKWNVLGEQVLIGTFGNGVEPYNFYRRTGFPNTVQPNLEPSPGQFIRSMFYPEVSVNANSNISQKASNAEPVFWDTTSGPSAN